jgi:hypothetical protein
MTAASELVSMIEAHGGQFLIDGEELVIRPGELALPVLETIRTHKGEIISLLLSRENQSADGPLDSQWMLEQCAYRDGWWGGIGSLHLDLARWLTERGKVAPASRRAFVAALQTEGFQVTSDGLVYGLVLKSDVEFHLQFQNPVRAKKAVSRKTLYKTPYISQTRVS